MQPWVSALALVLVLAWLEWGFRGGGAGLDATLIGPVTLGFIQVVWQPYPGF